MTFVTGDVLPASTANAWPRSYMEQEDLVSYAITLTAFRYADGAIPDTVGAAGKPKLVMGGWGSGTGIFQGEDAQEALKTETLCFEFVLPECYVAGQSVIMSITARINDAGGNSHTFDSLDVEAYEIAETGTAESDICATDAQTLAEIMTAYSFTITSTNLGPGDLVRIFIRTSIQGSFGGSFKAEIGGATMKLDIKG